jgi:23S rRNA (uracil1939-C5)-methyltransferase
VPGDGGVELELEPRKGAPQGGPAVDALVSALGEHARIGFGAQRRAGLRRYDLPGGGFLRVPSGGFTQVNWAVNTELVAALVEEIKRRNARTFVELYAGVGNFTIPLASSGLRGTAIELDQGAGAALREALREQALSLVDVLVGDVAATLDRVGKKLGAVDLVLLDPPRSGAKAAIASILSLGPESIAYVACDPVTLARDVRDFVAGGYTLGTVTCFDMFPQTHHVETLALLERSKSR